jgi:2-haloacid dehalogenase
LVDAWRGAYQPAMEPIRQGTRPFVTLDVLHRESLDRLLTERGLTDVDEADRQVMVRAWRLLDPWPDSVTGIARLKRKFVVATLSNGGVALLVEMAKHAGLDWDTVFSADLFRQYKPDPSVYLGAAELLDLPPAAVIMVAAHPMDLEAAAACGLRTALVDRPLEYGGRRVHTGTGQRAWDYSVASLEQLADQLGA